METFEGTGDDFKRTGNHVGDDLYDGVSGIKRTAASELKNLIADVEDLVARIADLKDTDVARVRTKVVAAIGTAKESLASRTDLLRRRAKDAASSADDYVHDSPWQAVGIAALVGAVMGILAARRS